MRIQKSLFFIGAVTLLGVALAQGVKQISVTLGGKNLKLDSVVVSGKTYVSLEQLKKALPNPTPSTPMGGANQVAASSGCVNELLFNGAWRFRVQKVAFDAAETAWAVTVELRNATNKTRYAFNSGALGGAEDLSLIVQSGTSLNLGVNQSNAAQTNLVLKSLAPGAAAVTTLLFYVDNDTDKPTKLLWAMTAANNSDKAPLSKEPGFRVDLTCQK